MTFARFDGFETSDHGQLNPCGFSNENRRFIPREIIGKTEALK
jgi:hypothetical protein